MRTPRRLLAMLVLSGMLSVAAITFADPPAEPQKRAPAALEALRKAREQPRKPSPNPVQAALTEHRGDGTAPNAALKAMQAAARRAKREQARKLRHQELQGRLHGREATATIRAELRTHARRSSQLQRIRRLAIETDPALLARIDGVIAREDARHERRLAVLIARAPQAKPAVNDDSTHDREHEDEVEE